MSDEPRPEEATIEQAEQRLLGEIRALQDAARAAGIVETDPLWPLIRALCSFIGALADVVGPYPRELRALLQVSRGAVDRAVEEARERVAAIEASSTERISDKLAERIDKHLAGRLWRMDWKASLTAVGAVAVACLVGIMLGYRVGSWQADGQFAGLGGALSTLRTPQSAARWTELIRDNPDVSAAISACRPLPSPSGGSPCAVPLWLAPAHAGTRDGVAAVVGNADAR